MKSKQHTLNKRGERHSGANRLLWVAIALVVFLSMVANFYFNTVDWALRLAIGIPLAVAVTLLALQTDEGRRTWIFFKSARGELRKVVWPTRQETVQTTLVVVAAVFITAFFLWGVDSLFLWLISLLTGQRG